MKKLGLFFATALVAVSFVACGNKSAQEEAKQEVQEVVVEQTENVAEEAQEGIENVAEEVQEVTEEASENVKEEVKK